MKRKLPLKVEYLKVDSIEPHKNNTRKHTKKQINQIANAIREFGFLNPVIVDRANRLIVGHGRRVAAQTLGMHAIPTVKIEHLSEDAIRAYMIADNKLAELAGWDDELLAIEFEHLMASDLSFAVDITGFEIAEIDCLLQSSGGKGHALDKIPAQDGLPRVSRLGDIWQLGTHTIACGDARSPELYNSILSRDLADLVFTDPPWNVRVNGHAGGKGRVHHREFPMASGEMTDGEFNKFLNDSLQLLHKNCRPGAICYLCMDWRHIAPLLSASSAASMEFKNLCVWVKDRAGMGSLYRSQHELVFVLKNGEARHTNNIQLGRFGRDRSNVWEYPSASTFSKTGSEGNLAALHPTVKPVAMVLDALLDCSAPGNLVLDPFLGSGSTLIAAEKSRRVCRGIELDPGHVDTAVRRWQTMTGKQAINRASQETFDSLEARGGVDV